MARKPRPKITKAGPQTLDMLEEITRVCRMVRQRVGPTHANRQLQDDMVLGALLCAFFDPICRSLRLIDQLSEVPGVRELLDCSRVARSTLSDALKRFDVSTIRDAVEGVRERLPELRHEDATLERLTQQVIAADGSSFRMAGEVAWALQRKRDECGRVDSQVKLHLQLDVRRWTMEQFALTGSADRPGGASEQAALGRMLEAGVIYLMDRGYCGYGLMRGILAAGAHLVLRLKGDMGLRAERDLELSEQDREAGVGADQLGHVGKGAEEMSRENPRGEKAPEAVLRQVKVWDGQKQEWVALLTDLLDVEAWVIAYLYRCRWIIELFFRWLKVTAGFAHLLSHSPNGVQVQMYVGLIGTLLIYLHTGMPVSKYSLYALSVVARGQARYADVLPGLLRLERERRLEKERLARKKAAAKKAQ
jgi:hypothetical protein